MDHGNPRDNDPKKQLSPFAGNETNNSAPKNRTPWNTISARVISLVSRKGGVGKTTSAINLGAALALSGHSVLLVGVDPQCGITHSLGYGLDDLPCSLSDIFVSGTSLTHLVQGSPLKNLSFVTPRIGSLVDEEEYNQHMERHADTFISEIDHSRNFYDTIIIDCPPSLGAVTRAALLASDTFLVPVQAEELCRDSLGPLLSFVESFRDSAYSEIGRQDPQPLELEGLFLTMVNSRTRMSKHVTAQVNEDYGISLFKTSIPRTTRLTEMALHGKPAVIYDRRSAGSRAYFDLADEIVERFCLATENSDPDIDTEIADEVGNKLSSSENKTNDYINNTPVHVAIDPDPISHLDRFLKELRATTTQSEAVLKKSPETQTPEMVSLDDLLAEEERGANDEQSWDESAWTGDRELRDRLN